MSNWCMCCGQECWGDFCQYCEVRLSLEQQETILNPPEQPVDETVMYDPEVPF